MTEAETVRKFIAQNIAQTLDQLGLLSIHEPSADDDVSRLTDALLAAFSSGGYVIVPKEPSEHVICCGDESIVHELETHTYVLNGGDSPAIRCWRAMLSAAQLVPEKEQEKS